ncbi:hypothetical protein LTR05_004759 [Lithohypha guttulata]|uniref:ERCC4 domain-containing protein n=1 Tax=Lithohypha guttulata TaxID=1690604 RepID=A0AAN7SZP5_9EURO|nr:hypothetical protein LTR05_004759 [Lithohypha guttulata]
MAMTEVITLSSSPPGTPARQASAQHGHPLRFSDEHGSDDEHFFDSPNDVDLSLIYSDRLPQLLQPSSAVKAMRNQSSAPVKSLLLQDPKTSPTRQDSGLRDSALFDDSILIDDIDFPNEQLAKKRRLSPPTKSLAVKSLESVNSIVFDLSSEPDIVPQTCKMRMSTETSNTNTTSHDLSDNGDDLPELTGLIKKTSSVDERRRVSPLQNRSRFDKGPIELFSDDDEAGHDPIVGSSQLLRRSKPATHAINTTILVQSSKTKHKKSSSSSQRSSSTTTNLTSYTKVSKSARTSKVPIEDLDNIFDSSQLGGAKSAQSPDKTTQTGKASMRQAKTSTNKNAAAENNRLDKERKAAEKEAEKEQKRRERERKAAEKQRATDIAEVNKRKTDKKVSVEEMITDLPKAIKGKKLGNQVEAEMAKIEAEFSYYADELDMTSETAKPKKLGNIIKWRRKITATYDEPSEEWVPLERPKTVSEKHILVHLIAEDFCLIAAAGPDGSHANTTADSIPTEAQMKDNLDTYVTVLRSQHADHTIMLLLQDLTSQIKKIANAKNRAYTAAVRAQPNPFEPTSSAPTTTTATSQDAPPPTSTSTNRTSSKKRKQPSSSFSKPDLSFFTPDLAEDLLLHLQLTHQPLSIHHTTSADAYKDIVAFTQHLSTRPYRAAELDRNLHHASFCMASGQFRTGQGDPTETWILMLEQINRLTKSMALGIIDAGYDSPAALVEGFRREERSVSVTGGGRSLGGDTMGEREGRERARVLLEDVRRRNGRGVEVGDRRLGPQISRRLYKVFMGRDAEVRDGIA